MPVDLVTAQAAHRGPNSKTVGVDRNSTRSKTLRVAALWLEARLEGVYWLWL